MQLELSDTTKPKLWSYISPCRFRHLPSFAKRNSAQSKQNIKWINASETFHPPTIANQDEWWWLLPNNHLEMVFSSLQWGTLQVFTTAEKLSAWKTQQFRPMRNGSQAGVKWNFCFHRCIKVFSVLVCLSQLLGKLWTKHKWRSD